MFYDYLDGLCAERGISVSRLLEELGVSKSSASRWKTKGFTPSKPVQKKIADYFGMTVSNFMSGVNDTEKANMPVLNKKDEHDIAKDMERLRQNLESGEGLMFDGDPLSEEAKESILAAMKIGLEMAKVKNKEKYTPKKFRKENKDA